VDTTPSPGRPGLTVGQRGLVAIVALLATVLLGWLLGGSDEGAIATTSPTGSSREGVTVTGTGEVSGSPDVLGVDFAVEARAGTVAAALDRANEALDRMRTTLRKGGVAPADLQTANLSVYAEFSDNGREVVGYVAGQSLAAKFRDLDRAGGVISDTVESGGDAARLEGLGFDLEDDAELLADARRAAVADAKAKAELYASAAGRSVGQVVRIEEQVSVDGPIPYAGDFARAEAGADIAPVPTEPGTQTLTVSVVVEYAFG
jgi:uncharacterized protein YggE